MAKVLEDRAALAGEPAFPASARIALTETPRGLRFSMRGPVSAAMKLAGALGLTAPMHNRAVTGEAGALIRLGPDELLAMLPAGDAAATQARLSAAIGEPHSLVDISHRNVGLVLSGSAVEAVLAAGNPLDLDIAAFPVGMATRTLMGKAEIVLWRQAADRFHIDCWRTFAPYIHGFLSESAREYT